MKYFVNVVVSKVVDAKSHEEAMMVAEQVIKLALDRAKEKVERCEANNSYVP